MSTFQKVLTITFFVLLYVSWVLCGCFFIWAGVPLTEAIWPFNFISEGVMSVDDMSGMAMISICFSITSALVILNIVALISSLIERRIGTYGRGDSE